MARPDENRKDDIIKIETALGHTGDLDPHPTSGPTGFYGVRQMDGIKRFQKRNGLAGDGVVKPGGPTIRALSRALATQTAPQNASGATGRANSTDEHTQRFGGPTAQRRIPARSAFADVDGDETATKKELQNHSEQDATRNAILRRLRDRGVSLQQGERPLSVNDLIQLLELVDTPDAEFSATDVFRWIQAIKNNIDPPKPPVIDSPTHTGPRG